jgi:hypothetical protein
MQKSAWRGPVRTTLDLDDGLLAEAKALAARERLTLTRLIEEGLALRLRRATGVAAATCRTTRWRSAGRRSLWPGAPACGERHRDRLVTFDRNFVPLLATRQLLLLEG